MKNFKILIAEDEEMLLDLFVMLIESEFTCEIVTATNGQEAMDILDKQTDFSLIISDYKMPKATGGELFRYNSSRQNHPFFLFSGGDLNDYPELSDFSQVNQANRFFNKPFDESVLINGIKALYDLKL